MIEDSPFKTDSMMHNPKTGKESQHIKQVPVTEDTLAYLSPQKQSLYFDSEITHSNYR